MRPQSVNINVEEDIPESKSVVFLSKPDSIEADISSSDYDMPGPLHSLEDPLSTNINDTITPSITSNSNDFYQKEANILPVFGAFIKPFLDGTATPDYHKMMKNQFIDELCRHLDSNKLLISRNPSMQAWGYKRLEGNILNLYPNIIKDREFADPNRKKRRNSGILGDIFTKVAGRRLKRNKPKLVMISSPEFALSALRDEAVLKNLSKFDKFKALKMSHVLRTNDFENGLPTYLMSPDMIQFEVEIFLEKSLTECEKVLLHHISKLKSLGVFSMNGLVLYFTEEEPFFLQQPPPLIEDMKSQVGPCVFMDNVSIKSEGTIYISNGVQVQFPELSPEKLSIICWALYYLLDLTYPKNFSNVLGLLQEIFHKDKFKSQFSSKRLKNILEIIFR